ncbi:hypothetical protein C8Q80DRAFT_117602 [Daedaleopsis nitida]|nr:hypothetical protein C8Q80DRAFT_117602 [Daedaleopsis nitida]
MVDSRASRSQSLVIIAVLRMRSAEVVLRQCGVSVHPRYATRFCFPATSRRVICEQQYHAVCAARRRSRQIFTLLAPRVHTYDIATMSIDEIAPTECGNALTALSHDLGI